MTPVCKYAETESNLQIYAMMAIKMIMMAVRAPAKFKLDFHVVIVLTVLQFAAYKKTSVLT
jgi:hypothetical protein